jgi:cbb3-type cytochrome oxidase cytochrome c subunit
MAWFGKEGKNKEATPVERMELRGAFFLTSVLLVVLTYWMLFDEARPRRPWKDYQVRFNNLEYRMVQDELKEAQRVLAAKESEVKALEAELKAAEAAASGPEMENLLKEMAAKKRELDPWTEKVAFTKAELDEAHYVEEKALYDNKGNKESPEYKRAKEAAEKIEKRLHEAQAREEPLTRLLEDLEEKVQKRNENVRKIQDKLADLRAPVQNLERRLVGIRGRIPEIHQVIIEGLDVNEFKQPILRVDRCTTCHVGNTRAGFEKARLEQYGVSRSDMKVFATHPYLEALIGKHPTNQYGCSACHQGQPPALDADEAHAVTLPKARPAPTVAEAAGAGKAEAAEAKANGAAKAKTPKGTEAKGEAAKPSEPAAGHDLSEKHFYWERPLLLGEMIQASCRRCHAEQDIIPLAPVYSEARAMVADLGCYGCHNIRGFEKGERVGPDLTKIRTKVDPSWLLRWVRNPKEYLPQTKMPVFPYGLGKNAADFMTSEQVTAIAAYLLKSSADDPEQRGSYRGGDAQKGQALVKSVGCLGCHVIKGLAPAAPEAAAAPSAASPAPAEAKPDAQQPPPAAETKPEAKDQKGQQDAKEEAPPAAKAKPEGQPIPPAQQAGEAKPEAKPEEPKPAEGTAAQDEKGAKDEQEKDPKAAAQARLAAMVAVKPSPPPGNAFGPDLSQIASKVNADWLYRWLLNPKRFSPTAKMPNLRLSPEDAGHITAYLMTLGRKREEPGLQAKLRDEAVIKEGERLIRKRGCFGCHNIIGFESADKIAPDLTNYGTKRLLELFFGEAVQVKQTWADFTLNKLLNPQVYATERVEQIMPNFRFSPEQARALRVFLKAQNDDRSPKHMTRTLNDADVALQDGRRLVRRYNCDGCHVLENQGGAIRAYYEQQINLAPPPLVAGHLQEGAKVQSTWLYEWLARPTSVRPWLQVRMPTFGLNIEEATNFAKYFGALAGVRLPYEFVLPVDISTQYLQAGRQLASKDYFDCFSCHVQGAKNPEGPPEGWAPDLALARYRLRPAWIEQWLRDPQRIQPGTKMPSFFTDPEGIPDDILRDPKDPDKKKQLDRQIKALTDYVMSLGDVAMRR